MPRNNILQQPALAAARLPEPIETDHTTADPDPGQANSDDLPFPFATADVLFAVAVIRVEDA